MLYFTRLLNALTFIGVAALIIVQRDTDGGALVSGYHGLGLALLIAFSAALLNFRGAMSAAYLTESGE